jgi:hypothetical protein
MPIPSVRSRRRQPIPKAAPSVTKPSPTGYYAKNGTPHENLDGFKVGDVLYKHRAGKLVAVSVTSVKPFAVQGPLADHGSRASR